MTLPPGARNARRIAGGDINDAWRVVLADGRDAFVKTRPRAAPGEYAAEAAGLGWLAEPTCLRVPAVLAVADDYLALEWIEPGCLDAAGAEELGRGLASLHAAGAPGFGGPFSELLRIGALALPNSTQEDWPAFYADCRLLALRDQAGLSRGGRVLLDRVCGRIAELAGPQEPPARLHGDLWAGNVHAGRDGRPWLIDPAVYGGHREVDLAMLSLFGGPERTFAAYAEVNPLADGWHDRVALWQLFPLLVHAALFGGAYPARVEELLRRLA